MMITLTLMTIAHIPIILPMKMNHLVIHRMIMVMMITTQIMITTPHMLIMVFGKVGDDILGQIFNYTLYLKL